MVMRSANCLQSVGVRLLSLWLVWMIAGCAVLPSAIAFTGGTTVKGLAPSSRSTVCDTISNGFERSKSPTELSNLSRARSQTLRAVPELSSLGMDENSSAAFNMIITAASTSPEKIPPLDAIGVDPGQALFYSTIVHWTLWGTKTIPNWVAGTFDAVCIGITLWDGTVRAAMVVP